jgi:hypothetical protein
MHTFEVFVEHELKLVKIVVQGEMFLEDGEKIITVARTTAAEHGYDVLYDLREATTTVPFASWFHLPRNLPVFQNPRTRRVKAAVLASPKDKAVDDYKFFELVSDNVGLKLRIFFNEEKALKWLQRP